jgi:hypothetical protein
MKPITRRDFIKKGSLLIPATSLMIPALSVIVNDVAKAGMIIGGAAAPITPTLNALYYFEDGSGNGLVDSSGTLGGPGTNTLSGTATFNTSYYRQGSSSLNVTENGLIRTNTNLSSGFSGKHVGGTTTALTAGGWCRFHTIGELGVSIVCVYDSAFLYGWNLKINGPTYGFYTTRTILGLISDSVNTNGNVFVGTAQLNVDTWYFIAMTWDGTHINVYHMASGGSSLVQDVTDADFVGPMATSIDSSLRIGTNVGGDMTAPSVVDGVFVYNYARTAGELLDIALNGVS